MFYAGCVSIITVSDNQVKALAVASDIFLQESGQDNKAVSSEEDKQVQICIAWKNKRDLFWIRIWSVNGWSSFWIVELDGLAIES